MAHVYTLLKQSSALPLYLCNTDEADFRYSRLAFWLIWLNAKMSL